MHPHLTMLLYIFMRIGIIAFHPDRLENLVQIGMTCLTIDVLCDIVCLAHTVSTRSHLHVKTFSFQCVSCIKDLDEIIFRSNPPRSALQYSQF